MQTTLQVDIRGIDLIRICHGDLVVTMTRMLGRLGCLTLLRLSSNKSLLRERIFSTVN